MAEEKDVTAESSTATQTQTSTENRVANEKGENVPWNEDKRWKEFIAEKNTLKDYKDLGGSPAEIRAKLQRLEYLNSLVEQAETEAKSEPEDKQKQKLAKEIRNELLQFVPELAELGSIKQQHDHIVQSAIRRAGKITKEIMEEHGLDTDAKSVASVSEILSDIIKGDEDLLDDFLFNTSKSVKNAFDRYANTVRTAIERKSAAKKAEDKEPLKGLPKTHVPGGGSGDSGTAKSGEPKNLKDAMAMAKKALQGR